MKVCLINKSEIGGFLQRILQMEDYTANASNFNNRIHTQIIITANLDYYESVLVCPTHPIQSGWPCEASIMIIILFHYTDEETESEGGAVTCLPFLLW